MRIIVQNCPSITAFLVDEIGNTLASETGPTELEAIGRLVTTHPEKFGLTEVTGKYGPISLD